MKTKKGQALSILSGIVTALVAVAIILVVGLLIMAETESQVIARIDTTAVVNESFTFVDNASYVQLAYSPSSVALSCSSVIASKVTHCGTCNYTFTKGLGIIMNNDSVDCYTNTSTTTLINYTYKEPSDAYNATGDVKNATTDIAGWLPIIVVTIIGGVLLSLVALFRRSR